MFYGTDLFMPINGGFDVVGYLAFSPSIASAATVIPRGTWLDRNAHTSESVAMLATGSGIGYMTQDMTQQGLTIENFAVVRDLDYPLKPGDFVSLRRPTVNSEFEIEGPPAIAYTAQGNLLVTTGTGALTNTTAFMAQLSVNNGMLYVAQTGDTIMFEMIDSALTPKTVGNLRVKVRYVGGGAKK